MVGFVGGGWRTEPGVSPARSREVIASLSSLCLQVTYQPDPRTLRQRAAWGLRMAVGDGNPRRDVICIRTRFCSTPTRHRGMEMDPKIMATDYDAPRKTDEESEDSIEELKIRRNDKNPKASTRTRSRLRRLSNCPVPTSPTRNSPSGCCPPGRRVHLRILLPGEASQPDRGGQGWADLTAWTAQADQIFRWVDSGSPAPVCPSPFAIGRPRTGSPVVGTDRCPHHWRSPR